MSKSKKPKGPMLPPEVLAQLSPGQFQKHLKVVEKHLLGKLNVKNKPAMYHPVYHPVLGQMEAAVNAWGNHTSKHCNCTSMPSSVNVSIDSADPAATITQLQAASAGITKQSRLRRMAVERMALATILAADPDYNRTDCNRLADLLVLAGACFERSVDALACHNRMLVRY